MFEEWGFSALFLADIVSPRNPDPDSLQYICGNILWISGGLWTLVVLLGFTIGLYYYGREAKKRRKIP
jgi:hypothetical protein